jgi:hypothetical protein
MAAPYFITMERDRDERIGRDSNFDINRADSVRHIVLMPAPAGVVAIQAGVAAVPRPIAMAVQPTVLSFRRFIMSIDLHHMKRYA